MVIFSGFRTEYISNVIVGVIVKEYKSRSNSINDSILSKKIKRYMKLKKILDIIFSLIVLLPIIVIILCSSVLIIIGSKGPVFYRSTRLGKDMKPFIPYKLRTMYYKPGDLDYHATEEEDPRITKIGRKLRKYRIDELPQVINVLKGEMSFIGPRPFVDYEYNNNIEGFENRTLVRPGLSGLAQVRGGNDLSLQEKFDYDMKYITNMSLRQDISIFIETIRVVFTGDGAR